MAFALSGSTITQTGTDSNLSGLSSIAGVTTDDIGEATVYDIGALRLVVNGTLSIAQSGTNEQLRVAGDAGNNNTDIEISGTLNVGTQDSNPQDYSLNGGIAAIYESRDTGTDSAGGFGGTPQGTGNAGNKPFITVLASGTLNVYGREVFTSGGMGAVNGATIVFENARYSGFRSYWYTPNYTIKDTVLDTQFFILANPTEFSGVENRNSGGYLAMSSSTPVASTYTFKNIPALPTGDNLLQFGTPNTSAVGNLINTQEGSDYNYTNTDSSRNYTLNFKREVQALITDASGTDIDGAKFQVRGKSGQVDTQTTNSSGDTGTFEVDIAQNVTTSGTAAIAYFSKNNNNTDVFDYRAISYGHNLFSPPTENLKGTGTKVFNVSLLDDTDITESTKATVDAYTTIDDSNEFYDRAKAYLFDNYAGETATIVTKTGNTIDAGSYNITIDATAASAFAFDGTTITLKSSAYTGNLTTTGTITLSNGATVTGTLIDSTADSSLSFSGIDSWTVYASEANRDSNTSALDSGTGTENYRFNFVASTTYYLRLVVSGETTFKNVTPTASGNTEVSLQTAALLTAVTAGLSFIPKVIYVDTTASSNGSGTNVAPYDNLDDAVTLFNTGGYTYISLKSTIANPAMPTASLAGTKVQGVDKFSAIDINGQRLDGATIQNMLVYGTQSASDTTGVIIEDSRIIGDYTNLRGIVKESEVLDPSSGAITITVAATATFLGSSIINALDVTIDLTSSVFFGMRGCDGPVVIDNMTGGTASFEMNSGEITFNASCTGGNVRLNDTLSIIDNSNGSTLDTTAVTLQQVLRETAALEGSVTYQQGLRIMLAAVSGKLSGAAGTTINIRDVADTKNRISATVDADGNRTAVTLDGS